MPIVNHSLDLARAVTTALSTGATGALVDDVYREGIPANPNYPFVSVGVIIESPEAGWCYDGIEASFAVSVYTTGKTAVDCYNISHAVRQDLHGKELGLAGGGKVHSLRNTTSQTLGDDEKDHWRAICQFNALTSE